MCFDNKIIYKSKFFDVVLVFKVEHVILTYKLKYTLTKDFRVFCGYIFRLRHPLWWDSLLVCCILIIVIISSHFNFDKNLI